MKNMLPIGTIVKIHDILPEYMDAFTPGVVGFINDINLQLGYEIAFVNNRLEDEFLDCEAWYPRNCFDVIEKDSKEAKQFMVDCTKRLTHWLK